MSRSSRGRRVWRCSLVVALAGLTVVPLSGFATPGGDESRIRGVTPDVVASAQASPQAHLDGQRMMRLTLVVQPRHPDDLKRFVDDVVDPHSPRFRQFLTFEQWKARYAPTDGQVAAVRGFARANGLSVVHEFANNLAVKVEGDVATVEHAFDLRLNQYRYGDRTFFSNDRDPAVPRELAGLLKDVQGLNSYYQVRPAGGSAAPADVAQPVYRPGPFMREETAQRSGAMRAGTDFAGGLQPQICCGTSGSAIEAPDLFTSEGYDLAALQRFSKCCNPTHNAGGSPKETSIAVIGNNKIAASDLNTFAAQYGMAVNLTQVELNEPACCDNEMTMDIESVTAFANSFGSYLDTAHVFAYEGGGTLVSDDLDAWEEAHSRDQARSASTSFGAYEDYYGGVFGPPSISDFTDVINAMAAVGWTMTASSGDHGATDSCEGRSVNFPASSPYVVASGGTVLSMTNNAGKPKFSSEVTWGGPGCGGTDWPGQNMGGGGGGCASTEPAGWWQAVVSLPCDKRALPDISLNAGNGQEWYWGVQGGWKATGGGTSIVSPELAGFFAQVNSYLLSLGHICGGTYNGPCAPIGMPNAMIWLMGASGSSATGRNPFYDVTSGCNGGQNDTGYCAGPGYDLATGWGSINMLQMAWGLIDVVSHGVLPETTFTGPAVNNWYNADAAVQFSIVSPNPQGTTAAVGLAGYTAKWDTVVADVKSHATPGSGDSFYDGPETTGSTGSLSLAAAGLGCHTAHVRAWDNAGQTGGDETYGPVCYDNQPPDVFCAKPDTAWHATDVTINCAAFDQANLSGLDPADQSFTLTTSVPAGTETDSAYTGTRRVCDKAGNCVTAGPIGPIKVDKLAPSIAIAVPTATPYVLKQPVLASYSCTDGGSGVATCAGPVPSGSPIDTSSAGTKTFTVNAADNVGNTSSQSVGYAVTYRICLVYDPAKPSSSRAYNFTLQLCDYVGNNVSQVDIAVTATAVDGVASRAKPLGSLNPNNKFLYGPGTSPGASYLYVLDTLGLSSGSHLLNFTVQGDPVPHTAPFLLKK
jgi:hypothetical protein